MRPKLDDIMRNADDSYVCNETFKIIGERYQHIISADEYSPEERVVMLTWHANGIIRNGGFEYLFSGYFPGDLDFKLTIEAFEQIDPHAAKIFRQAVNLFPGGKIPTAIDERHDTYTSTPEKTREGINESFWELDLEEGGEFTFRRKLAEYIRKNKRAFEATNGHR